MNTIQRLKCLWYLLRLHPDGLDEATTTLHEMRDFYRVPVQWRQTSLFQDIHQHNRAHIPPPPPPPDEPGYTSYTEGYGAIPNWQIALATLCIALFWIGFFFVVFKITH